MPFFTLLANRKFPVTDWIRHACRSSTTSSSPTSSTTCSATCRCCSTRCSQDYVQRYGAGRSQGAWAGRLRNASRLYWYTIEFGLIRESEGLQAHGVAYLSSSANCRTLCRARAATPVALQLARTMRTRYKIDTFQQTYFVIDSFQQLFDMTAADLSPIYQAPKGQPEFAANESARKRSPRKRRQLRHGGFQLRWQACTTRGIQHHLHMGHAGHQPVLRPWQSRHRGGEHDVVAVGIPAHKQLRPAGRFLGLERLQPGTVHPHLAAISVWLKRASQVPAWAFPASAHGARGASAA